MSEIKIKRPIDLQMEAVETDDYIPSIRMLVDIEVKHPTGFLKYQANDIWFECAQWDEFTKNLINLSDFSEEVLLKDMSEYFKLSILKESVDKYQFKFSCQEPEIGEGAIQVNFLSTVDTESLIDLVNSFQSFPKWW